MSYTITGPASFTQNGTIDVSHSNTVSAVLGPFAVGGGYNIALTAVSTDGSENCAGAAPFTVMAGQTTSVSVPITCHQAPHTGSVAVNGTLNLCPQIDGLDATPAEVLVGGSIGLTATAHDADNGPSPLSAQWTATSGVFTDATALDHPLHLHRALERRRSPSRSPTATPRPVARPPAAVTVTCTARTARQRLPARQRLGRRQARHLPAVRQHAPDARQSTNVASDLEQMPHLLNFIRGNGTMMANDHTSSSRTPRAASSRR